MKCSLFVQQTVRPTFDLPARLQRAAAELDSAVQRANLIHPHVIDHHALARAGKTLTRVTNQVIDDAMWQALMRGGCALPASRGPAAACGRPGGGGASHP